MFDKGVNGRTYRSGSVDHVVDDDASSITDVTHYPKCFDFVVGIRGATLVDSRYFAIQPFCVALSDLYPPCIGRNNH